MTEEREESRIQWHPAFYAATKLELRDNIDELEFYPEYNLSKKPLQADLLIIEKNRDVQIKNVIGHIFRRHNIVEYKSPGDGMTVDELERLGISFTEHESGIYYSQSFFIPTQIIVTRELSAEEHRSLRILSRNADENDVKGFIKEILSYATQGEKADVQAVLKVSGTANYDLYEKIRSESDMRSFLDDIKNEGRTEALEQTAKTLFDMGMAVDKIAQAVHTSVNIVEEWLSVRK